ncbi:E3 ubiquitin-protein ligase ARIH2-like isoform X2 [Xenia sp. Carnegie-2017]|uniref:E3 ubiquitin-protein ligase ARIH2-like isoform X2 n=1 Tax=Xenia sp. Carnegie-2017 TaxID=2897299 RepID=UPI001F04E8C1|nr:E3 ubiquitin-protein ligase ARIH2-like isoform X2 [Xenia sp. Carnegie-2017]
MSSSSEDEDSFINSNESDDEDDYYDYNDVDEDAISQEEVDLDPEAFEYRIITEFEAEEMFDDCVENLAKRLKESRYVTRLLLTANDWDESTVFLKYNTNRKQLFSDARIISMNVTHSPQRNHECQVCFQSIKSLVDFGTLCKHKFCRDCWLAYISVQLENGLGLGIECMMCNILVGPDNLLNLGLSAKDLKRFKSFLLKDQIRSHPLFQWCPGPNCSAIAKAETREAKRTVCTKCHAIFCFQCGQDYHAPADCRVIKRWLTKCQDDSETANYIEANTKDCPKCTICIEKNGGCNHMQCYKCQYEFCWMCLGNWNEHNREYYECSIYKENPSMVKKKSGTLKAREALTKYLFYYERWHNHGASLRLEAQTRDKIDKKIQEKVNNSIGTWIDWQYLLDAAALLAKCRYTIKYTYPFAYYLEDERKDLGLSAKVTKSSRDRCLYQKFDSQLKMKESKLHNSFVLDLK